PPPSLGVSMNLRLSCSAVLSRFCDQVFASQLRTTFCVLAILIQVFTASLSYGQNQPEKISDGGETSAANSGIVQQPLQPGIIHIVPFGNNAPIKKEFAPAGAHLTYWGGPVISQIHVVAVFWGPNVNAAITGPNAIDQFFTDITNSRY